MNTSLSPTGTADPALSSLSEPRTSRERRLAALKRLAAYLLGAALAVFFFYRMATFTPVALDAPGTLRPILYRWFLRFVTLHAHPEQAFSTWSTFCFAASMIPPALAWLAYTRSRWTAVLPRWTLDFLGSRTLLFLAVAVCLFLCRYPLLLENELNPDEGQFIASAHKLFYDSNYFRSVDCGTSGPFNIYPLMLPAVFGFSPDYASSRVVALLALLLGIYLLYRTVALLSSDELARLAILPPFAAFAVFKHPDLVDYNSEHIPLLLTALSLYFAVRVLRDPGGYPRPVFLLGLVACASFFTKMQVVPMVAALAAVAIAYVYATHEHGKFWRPPLILLAGAAPLAIANAVLCLATGVWRDFRMAYIVTNSRYADFGGTLIGDLTRFIDYLVATLDTRYFLFTFLALAAADAYQRRRPPATEQTAFVHMAGIGLAVMAAAILLQTSGGVANYFYLVFVVALLVPAHLALTYSSGSFGCDPVRWFGLSSTIFLASALFSIYKAHRTFPHYLLFLFMPVCALLAWMLIRQAAGAATRRSSPAIAFPLLLVVLTIATQGFVWASQDDQAFRRVAYTIRPLEGPLISAMTEPDDQIVVWGWTVHPYLGSGRVPGTRDTNMANFFRWPEISAYYRERFLRDMGQTPPALFIDAVGPTSWAFTDRQFNRFEEFPEIKSYIEQHYVHLADLYEQRYFMRRDLVRKRRLPFIRDLSRCEKGALRCLDTASTEVRRLAPVHLPGHALLEAQFTPAEAQSLNATVFSNEATGGSCRGFQLYHVQGDAYRLALGLGSDWALSKDLSFPPGKPASLWIEFNGSVVTIRQGGEFREQMFLPRPVVDAGGPITLGSWIGGQRTFAGSIRLFQITDLEKLP